QDAKAGAVRVDVKSGALTAAAAAAGRAIENSAIQSQGSPRQRAICVARQTGEVVKDSKAAAVRADGKDRAVVVEPAAAGGPIKHARIQNQPAIRIISVRGIGEAAQD